MSYTKIILCLGVFATISAKADSLTPGRRVVSSAVRPIWHEPLNSYYLGGYQMDPLGVGTITEIYSDGSAKFVGDHARGVKSVETVLTKEEVKKLQLSSDCPDLGKKVYSTENESVIQGNGHVNSAVGFGALQETFGSCSSGLAVLSRENTKSIIVPAQSLKHQVQCSFINQRAFSGEKYQAFVVNGYVDKVQGSGVPKEVYGDCETGIVVFKADRDPGNLALVSASSLKVAVSTLSMANPAQAQSTK